MRTLAIDLGSKRIGLAMSDAGGTFATPIEVIANLSPEAVVARIVDVVKREDVTRIVIGLPLNMDGSLGPAARSTIAWGGKLAVAISIRPIFVDERLSSFAAEGRLNDRKRAGEKLTRGKKKQQLDALAAAGFLQEFLDGKLAAIEVFAG